MSSNRLFFIGILCLLLGTAVCLAHSANMPVSGSGANKQITLILDAGHGGEDGGALTSSGHRESNVNLAIVNKLDSLLVFCGTKPVLTRRDDRSLHDPSCITLHEKKVSDLKNRVSMINGFENAIMISVHQNSFTDTRYKGFQVFYSPDDISRQWGEHTQALLRRAVDPENERTAKILPESIYLFRHINCPSILVECGFLSNGEEAALLLTDHYQKKLTLALAGTCLRQLHIVRGFPGG